MRYVDWDPPTIYWNDATSSDIWLPVIIWLWLDFDLSQISLTAGAQAAASYQRHYDYSLPGFALISILVPIIVAVVVLGLYLGRWKTY